MFRASLLSVVAVGAVLTLPVVPAHATLVLPAASITLTFDQYSSGTFTFVHTASGASAGASASVDESSGPTLSATSSGQSFAAAQLTYYAAINAPVGVTSVPIDIAYSYALVGITDGTENPVLNPSAAFMRLSYSGISPIDIVNNNTNDSNAVVNGTVNTITVSGVYQGTAATNTKLILSLQAGANGAGGSAFLDPTLSIDPSFFTDNPQYSQSDFSVSDSSGVANGPAVDVTEPGSLLLLGASLLGCGLDGHRSRRHSAASLDVT